MTLSPEQRTIAAELLSRGTNINCFEEADLIIDTITNLIARGVDPTKVVHWLTILPRVTKLPPLPSELASGKQLGLLSPVDDLPAPLQRAAAAPVKHRTGARAGGNPEWLRDPDTAPSKLKRRGRALTGLCAVCDDEFEMNPTGRPRQVCAKPACWAARHNTHRKKQP